jgi:hypothetical protein
MGRSRWGGVGVWGEDSNAIWHLDEDKAGKEETSRDPCRVRSSKVELFNLISFLYCNPALACIGFNKPYTMAKTGALPRPELFTGWY